MKSSFTLDTTVTGILKSISYLFVCFYAWLNNTGLDVYAFHVLIGFMVLDMIFGAWKAKRVPTLNNPTSKEAKKGIAGKMIMFSIPIVVGFMWGLFDKENAIKVVNTSLIALAVAEGYSVIGNAGAVYTGKNITEFDAVTYVFKSISSVIKSVLEKMLTKLKSEN